MRTSRSLTIAIAMLLATSGGALGEPTEGAAVADADCNRVFKAKSAADKNVSSEQLARDLSLPLEKVNSCLLLLRHGRPQATPPSAQ